MPTRLHKVRVEYLYILAIGFIYFSCMVFTFWKRCGVVDMRIGTFSPSLVSFAQSQQRFIPFFIEPKGNRSLVWLQFLTNDWSRDEKEVRTIDCI